MAAMHSEASLVVSNGTASTIHVETLIGGSNTIQGADVPSADVFFVASGPWKDVGLSIDGIIFPVDINAQGCIIRTSEGLAWQPTDTPTIANGVFKAFLAGMASGLLFYGFGWQMRMIRQIGRVSPEIP